MPTIRFSHDFNWHDKGNVTIAYKADHEYPVPQACADAAVAAGAAVKIGADADSPRPAGGAEPWRRM